MITFYHNPECGTSRNALAIVQASGDAAGGLNVIEYLRDPPSRERLVKLLAAADLSPREAMRVKGNEVLIEREGVGGAASSDTAVLDAMMRHPILINRPLVEGEKGTVLARPSERVADVLLEPPASYAKEDGEVVSLQPVGGLD